VDLAHHLFDTRAVSEAIEHAKESVFIEDWWLVSTLEDRRMALTMVD
jgi:hypothetical protein